MISNRNFVFTGLQTWDMSIGSNARDIALEVSKTNKVLYVNTPLSMFSADLKSQNPDVRQRQKVLRKQCTMLRQVNENLWILDYPFTILPASSLPDGVLFDMVNRINNRRIFRLILKVIKDLGFRNIIHFTDNDIYRSFYGKDFLKPDLSVYYRRDNLPSIDFWKRHATRLEPKLIAKSDLVVCNSEYLAQVARIYNPNTHNVGQGIDLSTYDPHKTITPDDMAHIARPIVGYLGHITSLRLDADLIYNLAKENSTRSFVLVGSTDEVFATHALHTLDNVHFLGPKQRQTVPHYINAFDVCLNPQIVNDLTIGNYPRKIDEYLALGKPTLATTTEAMMIFKDHVYLCNSLIEYNQSLDKAIDEIGNQTIAQQRIDFAQTHSWANSVEKMYKAIKNTL